MVWTLNNNERWMLAKNHAKLQRRRCLSQKPSEKNIVGQH